MGVCFRVKRDDLIGLDGNIRLCIPEEKGGTHDTRNEIGS